MSVGYSQLMNQVGILQILFQHFEKYIMKDEDIKSVRMLQIELLKKKLSKTDINQMMQDLLSHIESVRNGREVDLQAAHNLTLLLIDVDEYRNNFEKLLQQETSKYYSTLSK